MSPPGSHLFDGEVRLAEARAWLVQHDVDAAVHQLEAVLGFAEETGEGWMARKADASLQVAAIS
jgi:hypothetical protein